MSHGGEKRWWEVKVGKEEWHFILFFNCRWNFTVGDVSLSLVEGMEEGELSCLAGSLDWSVRIDAAAGLLVAVDM